MGADRTVTALDAPTARHHQLPPPACAVRAVLAPCPRPAPVRSPPLSPLPAGPATRSCALTGCDCVVSAAAPLRLSSTLPTRLYSTLFLSFPATSGAAYREHLGPRKAQTDMTDYLGRRRSVDVGGLALALADHGCGHGWGGWEETDSGETRCVFGAAATVTGALTGAVGCVSCVVRCVLCVVCRVLGDVCCVWWGCGTTAGMRRC